MKILELNFEKGWRGGELQTLYNMQGFRSAGVTTELVCRRGSALECEAVKDSFRVHSFRSIFGVIGFLISQGNRYNFLHAQTSQILTYCIFTKFFHKRKVLFTRRVNFFQKGFFTKLKYRYTDKIIAISESVRKTVSGFAERNDIEIISDIVVKKESNTSLATETIGSLKIQNKNIIATTAALTEEKDPFTSLEAIKILATKRNDFVFLHFGNGNLFETVSLKIKEYNLEKIYFLMGFVERPQDFFPLFDVFIMTSREEGLGSSVLDAFNYKIPVVSTKAGGLADLIGNERGIACNVNDSSAVAEGIQLLLDDPQKKQSFIENSYSYVIQYHSMKYITDKYLELMKSIND